MVGDLARIAEMRGVAEQVNRLGRFDAVIHNAAVGYQQPRTETEDGLPQLFAVNALAPYVLTALVERPERLVYMSSGMHRGAEASLEDVAWTRRRWRGAEAYAESKLQNLLLAFAVARRWPGVRSNAVNPGWVPTKMGGPGAPDDLEEGCRTRRGSRPATSPARASPARTSTTFARRRATRPPTTTRARTASWTCAGATAASRSPTRRPRHHRSRRGRGARRRPPDAARPRKSGKGEEISLRTFPGRLPILRQYSHRAAAVVSEPRWVPTGCMCPLKRAEHEELADCRGTCRMRATGRGVGRPGGRSHGLERPRRRSASPRPRLRPVAALPACWTWR